MLRLVVVVLAFSMTLAVQAAESRDIALRHLYDGTSTDGIAELTPRTDAEARFGKGMLQFVAAVGHFGQGLYRYGFSVPAWGGRAPSAMMLPVPANPKPEPIDYDKLRSLLAGLVVDMDSAQKTLREAGVAGDYVIPVDVMKVGVDIDGDGKSGTGENIGAILGAALGLLDATGATDSPPPSELVIGLDRADAIWLAGYANIMALQADFLLAHDFHEMFESTFHRLFPTSGLPLEAYQKGRRARGQYELFDADSEVAIADAIAAIHTMNWPVVEPDRLKRVLSRLKTVTQLSRQDWAAIEAEGDDNLELLPNARQTSAVGRIRITQSQVDAWLKTLDTLDEIFEGKLLLPHWRFDKGFDLKAYFETATRTDLVMLLTGYDALPYLREGPVASDASFGALTNAFGSGWLGYAFWIN